MSQWWYAPFARPFFFLPFHSPPPRPSSRHEYLAERGVDDVLAESIVNYASSKEQVIRRWVGRWGVEEGLNTTLLRCAD